ncbi:MAG: serine hydrolase domain-containing protein [Polymorphobacter sp.]
MMLPRTLGLTLACLMLGTAAIAAPVADDTPASTGGGATFTVPKAWEPLANGPAMIVQPPEADTKIVIVDVAAAKDVSAAAAAAWKTYGAPMPPEKLVTPRSAKTGWDERAVVDYDTPPNARRAVQAIAYRRGSAWTVIILDGTEMTADKRGAAMSLVMQSLRPAGYVKENFAGKTPHPLDMARIETLKAFIAKGMAEVGVPGVGLAFIDGGKVVWEGGLGVRQLGKPEPVDAHTSFMVASNTKSMATMLLAKLVDQGKIGWDDPVVKAYPSFRLGSDATTAKTLVRNLVCACTGLPRKDYELIFSSSPAMPASDTFRQLSLTEPTSGFGEVFQYNNLMASAAGYIAGSYFYPGLEIGAAFDKAVQTEIFDPIGMADSTLSIDAALGANHADPHAYDVDGKVRVATMDLNRAFSMSRPAGGAWSSPHDLIRYVQLELAGGKTADGRQLISQKNLFERRVRGVPVGEDQWYGMGLMEDSRWGVPVIHHGGDLLGYHSDMFWLPGAQVGAIILTNGDDGAVLRGPLLRRMLELLYDGKPEAEADLAATVKRLAAERAEFRGKIALPANAAAVKALAASYVSPDLGPLKVERQGDKVSFRFTSMGSEVATRKNLDGTLSFVTVSPGLLGLDLVVGSKDGKRTLVTRDSQHEFVFTETAN